jgi:hypothetical protein
MGGNMRDLTRCQATKADGSPCERIVPASQKLCYSHDASRREDRRASASKAARSKLSSEIIAIRSEARQIMADIRSGDLGRGDGAVLLQACGLLLKAVNEGRKQSEYDEIRGEMTELRQLFERQKQREGGSWSA